MSSWFSYSAEEEWHEKGRPLTTPEDLELAEKRWAKRIRQGQAKKARRLQHLLDKQGTVHDAAMVAMEERPDMSGPNYSSDTVTLTASLLAREYKGEPRPLVARLASRKTDLPMRLFMLGLLWGVDPATDQAKPWDRALPSALGVDSRDVRRARKIYREVTEEWVQESADFQVPDRPVKAWGTPPRPDTIRLPLDIWRNGWHLTLNRHELGWLLARHLPNRNPNADGHSLRDAMRVRYLGFTKHVSGLSRARAVPLHEPAPNWVARALLRDIANTLPLGLAERLRVDWPDDFGFDPDERPERVMRLTIDGDPGLLVQTLNIVDPNSRILKYRYERANNEEQWRTEPFYTRDFKIETKNEGKKVRLVPLVGSTPQGNRGGGQWMESTDLTDFPSRRRESGVSPVD